MLILLVGLDSTAIDTFQRYIGRFTSSVDVSVVPDSGEALADFLAIQPDVAVIDMTTLGESGWSLARALRVTPRWDGPLIALVNDLSTNDRAVLGARCDAHVVKPFEPDELLDVVRGAVAHRRKAGENGERSAS